MTKLKSKLVRDILVKGYDVTWTDTDIIWFKSPIEYLRNLKSDFVIQSNAPYPDEAASNGPLRINSGFYRVRSTPVTIAAMNEIVEHASKSSTSEQPSFYMILCGGENGVRIIGKDKCLYMSNKLLASQQNGRPKSQPNATHFPTIFAPRNVPDAAIVIPNTGHSMIVEFLDRFLFPNGGVNNLWETDLSSPGEMFILHNNWIKSIRAKVVRLIERNLWFYKKDELICNYDSPAIASMSLALDTIFDGEGD
jgi:hypothetical protein